jgi:hypothetical protein
MYKLHALGIGSSPFQMKWILSILWSGFKVDAYNGVHDFTLFKFLKDVSTLASYTPLDASILNPDFSFEIDNIHFISLNEIKMILFLEGVHVSYSYISNMKL